MIAYDYEAGTVTVTDDDVPDREPLVIDLAIGNVEIEQRIADYFAPVGTT